MSIDFGSGFESIYQLKTHFPEAQYGEGIKKLNTTLAYSMIHKGPSGAERDLAQRLKWIGNNAGRRKRYLDSELGPQGLTPLHISVILGDVETARRILKAGATASKKDKGGWTAYHHACVLGNTDMIALFKQMCPTVQNAPTSRGRSADELSGITRPAEGNSAATFWYRDAGKELREGNGECFRSLTGADLIVRTEMAVGELLRAWKEQRLAPVTPNPIFSHAAKRYAEAGEAPTYLAPTTVPKAGLGLRIREGTVKPGQLVTHYHGEITVDADQMSAYRIGDSGNLNLDGKSKRGLGPMVNHSFPNAQYVPYMWKGFSRSAVVAVDPLQADQEVFVYYGPESDAYTMGPISELNWEGLHGFLREKSLNDRVKELRLANQLFLRCGDFDLFLRLSGIGGKINYLIAHPGIVWQLVAEGSITREEMLFLLTDKELSALAARNDLGASNRHAQVFSRVLELSDFLDQQESGLGQRILKCTVGIGQEQSARSMILAMIALLHLANEKPSGMEWTAWADTQLPRIQALVEQHQSLFDVACMWNRGGLKEPNKELDHAFRKALTAEDAEMIQGYSVTVVVAELQAAGKKAELIEVLSSAVAATRADTRYIRSKNLVPPAPLYKRGN